MSMDWGHIWTVMSPLVKGIMLLLVFLSIYSVTVFIERLLTFNKARKQSVKFALEIGQLLKQDKIREGIDLAKKYKESHVAKVVSAGLLEFNYGEHGVVVGHDTVSAAERAIERSALMTTADMKKGLGGLATIATTAPFIGLFATVIGIIRSFAGMAATGTGDSVPCRPVSPKRSTGRPPASASPSRRSGSTTTSSTRSSASRSRCRTPRRS